MMEIAVTSVVVTLFISGGSEVILMVTDSGSGVPGYRPFVIEPVAVPVVDALEAVVDALEAVLLSPAAAEPDAGAEEAVVPQAAMPRVMVRASTSASAFFIELFHPKFFPPTKLFLDHEKKGLDEFRLYYTKSGYKLQRYFAELKRL